MKAFEIIAEAPNIGPTTTTASGIVIPQSAATTPNPTPTNTSGSQTTSNAKPSAAAQRKQKLAYQSGKQQMATRANSFGYQSGKGLVYYDEKGRATPFKPLEATKTAGGKAHIKATGAIQRFNEGFLNRPFIKLIGKTASIVVPILQWIEDMAGTNALYDEGAFPQAEAGQIAADLRTYYTHICITRIITGFVAFIAMARASKYIVRGVSALLRFGGIPGLLLSLPASFAIEYAILAALNSETVQQWIAVKLMSWAYDAAELGGDLGAYIPPEMKNSRSDMYNAVKDAVKKAVSDSGSSSSNSTKAASTSTAPTKTSSSGNVSAQDLIKQLG